jgi:PIF1 helicase.
MTAVEEYFSSIHSAELGKTFVISLILDTIQAQSQIALPVASSRIAAILLEGTQTAIEFVNYRETDM